MQCRFDLALVEVAAPIASTFINAGTPYKIMTGIVPLYIKTHNRLVEIEMSATRRQSSWNCPYVRKWCIALMQLRVPTMIGNQAGYRDVWYIKKAIQEPMEQLNALCEH